MLDINSISNRFVRLILVASSSDLLYQKKLISEYEILMSSMEHNRILNVHICMYSNEQKSFS